MILNDFVNNIIFDSRNQTNTSTNKCLKIEQVNSNEID